MIYNDEESAVPKKVFAKCKSEAQLERFMKEAFEVPSNKSVKLTFRTTGKQRKHFVKDYVADQLSIAVAVHMDDA